MSNYVSANARSSTRARKDKQFGRAVLLLLALMFAMAGVMAAAFGVVTLGVLGVCAAFVIGSSVAVYGS